MNDRHLPAIPGGVGVGYRSEVIERQLAHSERNKVRASYNQTEYMEERRAMMQQWADMISTMNSSTS